MRIEGDYMVIYDEAGRIAGHFGIQRDVTDKHAATEQIRVSREQLRALEVIGATDFMAIPCGSAEDRARTVDHLATLV